MYGWYVWVYVPPSKFWLSKFIIISFLKEKKKWKKEKKKKEFDFNIIFKFNI